MAEIEATGRPDQPRAVIFGCSGPSLTTDERRFFSDASPAGFILFERNCREPRQVMQLVAELKEITGGARTPVLIDQEGGRVQRLKPPHWRDAPPASVFGRLAENDLALGLEAVELNARLIAAELTALGINVDCAPVVDVPGPDAHDVIGERAFGDDPETVAALGRAAAEGFLAMGVLPVIKHIPGHGRALADSHQELPVVDAAAEDLQASDFHPFQALKDMPWAMTAHVIYQALDRDHPATTSETVIAKTIRGDIGFAGVLVSDDIGMKALTGPYDGRAAAVLAAGCDLVLHCSGDLAEMEAAAAGAGPVGPETVARLANGEAARGRPGDWDAGAAGARLDGILADAPLP
jgi:beta-N-acetylhexosaminidase